MKRNDEPSRTGFTLMEMLVVMGIVAILAALLLPVLSRAKQKARQIQCVGNLHQLGLGLQIFVAGNHAYPSAFAGTNSDVPGFWEQQLERGGFDLSKSNLVFITEGVWHCPAARWGDWIKRRSDYLPSCYGYNFYGSAQVGFPTNTLGLHGQFVSPSQVYAPVPEELVVSPSEMMAMGESFEGYAFSRSDLLYLEQRGFAFERHQGRVNVTFCDGHVESPSLGFVFTNESDAALVRWNRDHQPHREVLKMQ